MSDPVTHLLDTHAWVWLVKGEPQAAPIVSLPVGTILGLASISVWEVGMLEAKGRLVLQPDVHTWMTMATAGLRVLPLDAEVALLASRLPGTIHGDPADRMIVATARVLNVPLITADARILDYARQGHVRVLEL